LIIGGVPSETSVELYNWQTGEQCQLKDLPEPVAAQSGTAMEGTPIFCGNYLNTHDKCYSFHKTSKTWSKVLIV
jgi:hypothetical protein